MPVKLLQLRLLQPFTLSKLNASKLCCALYIFKSVAHTHRLFLLIRSRRQFRTVSCIHICHTYIYSANSIGENVDYIQPYHLNLILLHNSGYYVVIWFHAVRPLNIIYQITICLQQTDLKLTIVNCIQFFLQCIK